MLEPNVTPKRNFKDVMNRAMHRINHKSREQTPSSEIFSGTKHIFDKIEERKRGSYDGKPTFTFRNLTTFGEHGDLSSVDATLNKTAPLVMEPKSRTLMRRVVSNLRTTKTNRLWRMPIEQEDTAEEYVIK